MSALLDAVTALEFKLIEAEAVGEAMDMAAGDQTPAWLLVYTTQLRNIRDSFSAMAEVAYQGKLSVASDDTEVLQ